MSLSSGLIAAVALAYMAIMFAIAFYGDRRSAPLPPRVRAWVYSPVSYTHLTLPTIYSV